jgi:hypothetical protein
MSAKFSGPSNFWEEAKRKEGTARKRLGLLPLDSASSTSCKNWMTVVRHLALTPNRRGFSYRNDFGGENNLAPFAQASEAARNCKPGYLWPPHLYQEQFQSRGMTGAVSTEEFRRGIE